MRIVNYSGRDLEMISISEGQILRHAMTLMSEAGLRLLPVVSGEGDLRGVIGDGDMRRYIAVGGSLEDTVSAAMNREPKVISNPMSAQELRHLMQWWGVEYLPLLEGQKLVALHVLWVGTRARDLTAVIMAGGLGSRLAPLTNTCPKPLLPIGGKPILTHIIEHLRAQGVGRFVLSVNYLSEMIVNHYGDGSDLGISIQYLHETTRMGTGGALGLIDADMLSEPFLCLNGDILNDIDVQSLCERHQKNNWNATMVTADHSHTIPYGVVRTTENGEFDFSEEKPTLHFDINAGIYVLTKSVLSFVPRGVFYDLPTLFSDIKGKDMCVGTFKHSGRWIDIGNISEYERAKTIFES